MHFLMKSNECSLEQELILIFKFASAIIYLRTMRIIIQFRSPMIYDFVLNSDGDPDPWLFQGSGIRENNAQRIADPDPYRVVKSKDKTPESYWCFYYIYFSRIRIRGSLAQGSAIRRIRAKITRIFITGLLNIIREPWGLDSSNFNQQFNCKNSFGINDLSL